MKQVVMISMKPELVQHVAEFLDSVLIVGMTFVTYDTYQVFIDSDNEKLVKTVKRICTAVLDLRHQLNPRTESFDSMMERIIGLIPNDLGITGTLMDIQRSAVYIPPENISIKWRELSSVLNRTLPFPPVEEYQVSILKILRNEE